MKFYKYYIFPGKGFISFVSFSVILQNGSPPVLAFHGCDQNTRQEPLRGGSLFWPTISEFSWFHHSGPQVRWRIMEEKATHLMATEKQTETGEGATGRCTLPGHMPIDPALPATPRVPALTTIYPFRLGWMIRLQLSQSNHLPLNIPAFTQVFFGIPHNYFL